MNSVILPASLSIVTALGASAQTTDLSSLALSLVNGSRAEHDLDPLETTETLTEAARSHADDMLARDYYSHESPGGGTVQDRVAAAGGSRWRLVAENIARCRGCQEADAQQVRAFHDGWMQSPGHRENILAEGLDSFGFGLAAGGDVIYAVQVFGGPGTAQGSEADDRAAPASQEDVRAAALDALNSDASNLQLSEDLNAAAMTLAEDAEITNGDLSLPSNPYSVLPDGAVGWTQLAVSAQACGGCGAHVVAGDGAYFAQRLRPQDLADFSHLGFAISANGDGRKVAVAVFGAR